MTTTVDRPRTQHLRRLRALYGSVAVSSFGDGIFAAAVPLATAALTRDPAAVALVSAAEMVPWLVMNPVAGALVDRWPYRAVMVAADLSRFALLLALTAMVATGTVTVPALAIIACLVMTGTVFFDTASQAVIADLANRDTDTLNRANGIVGSTTNAGRNLVGPPAGSATYAAVAWVPFLIDAITFLVSAALVALLPRTTQRTQTNREPIMRSIWNGAKWLAKHATLRSYCLIIAVGNLVYSAALATFVLYAQDVLRVAEATYGVLLSAGAVGGVIGGLIAAHVLRVTGDTWGLIGGMAVQAVAWLVIAATTSPVVAGAALALASIGTSLCTVVVVGARQRLTPPDMLGRVTATFRTFGSGALPAGAAIGGAIATAWGLQAPLLTASVGLGVVLLIPAAGQLGRRRSATNGGA